MSMAVSLILITPTRCLCNSMEWHINESRKVLSRYVVFRYCRNTFALTSTSHFFSSWLIHYGLVVRCGSAYLGQHWFTCPMALNHYLNRYRIAISDVCKRNLIRRVILPTMKTSSNEVVFRVTDHLWGEFTRHRWFPRTNGQWSGSLMFPLIGTWINGWLSNREAGDLRRHRAHYDFTVITEYCIPLTWTATWRSAVLIFPLFWVFNYHTVNNPQWKFTQNCRYCFTPNRSPALNIIYQQRTSAIPNVVRRMNTPSYAEFVVKSFHDNWSKHRYVKWIRWWTLRA